MELPFALALAVGSHSVFIFVLLSTVLSFSQLPCVQPAEAASGRFTIHDLFAVTASKLTSDNSAAVTKVCAIHTAPRRSFVAHPFVPDVHDFSASVRRAHEHRRVWDPGIRSTVSRMPSALTVATACLTPMAATMASTMSAVATACTQSACRNGDDAVAIAPPSSILGVTCQVDGAHNPKLLFHCSHPVLSRPTVPNIWAQVPTIHFFFGCDVADDAFRDDQDDVHSIEQKSCHHAFPAVSAVAFACLFPVTSELTLLCSIRLQHTTTDVSQTID